MNAAIFAPGESLTREHCEAVSADLCIAVCDAYRLMPRVDALVANDAAWWSARRIEGLETGQKFSTRRIKGVTQVDSNSLVSGGTSSGVLALWVARQLGARRMILVGFDHNGSHFFGPHIGTLKNTDPSRWPIFTAQFKALSKQFALDGIEVLNCTEGSKLNVFPKGSLQEGIERLRESRKAA